MMGQTGYEINLPEVSKSSIFQEFPFTNQSKVQFWTRYRCRHVSLVVIECRNTVVSGAKLIWV